MLRRCIYYFRFRAASLAMWFVLDLFCFHRLVALSFSGKLFAAFPFTPSNYEMASEKWPGEGIFTHHPFSLQMSMAWLAWIDDMLANCSCWRWLSHSIRVIWQRRKRVLRTPYCVASNPTKVFMTSWTQCESTFWRWSFTGAYFISTWQHKCTHRVKCFYYTAYVYLDR